jgi:hypothetical protein
VLGQRIAKAGDAGRVANLMTALPMQFHHDIAPHFCSEETGLLPLLEVAGERALVRRHPLHRRHYSWLISAVRIGSGRAPGVGQSLSSTHEPLARARSLHCNIRDRLQLKG